MFSKVSNYFLKDVVQIVFYAVINVILPRDVKCSAAVLSVTHVSPPTVLYLLIKASW